MQNLFGLAGGTYRADPEAVRQALDAHRAERIGAETYVLRLEVEAQRARLDLAEHDRRRARARMPW